MFPSPIVPPSALPRCASHMGLAATTALLVFTARSVAQTTAVTIPAAFATSEGSVSGSIWRAGLNRVQCLYDTSLFTSQGIDHVIAIDRVQWRSAGGTLGAAVTYPTVELWLGDSATDMLSPSTTFAANRTASHTLVYSGPVTVNPAAGTTPNSFTIDVPLATPFAYAPTGGADLLLEIVIHGTPSPAVGTTVSTSSSAAVHLANTVRSVGSNTALTGTTSGFAPVVKFGFTRAISGPVVINEFVYDDTGVDNREFVELFNRTSLPVDLSGWQLAAADAQGANASYTIPASTLLLPGAYYVLGSPMVAGAHQIVGTTDLWENDTESLTLRDHLGRIVDTLVYESKRGLWNPVLAEGEGLWGELITTDGVASSWSRCPNGRDTDINGFDFWLLPATPGQSNAMYVSLPYARDFDSQPVGSAVSGWSSSFAAPHVVDPLVPGPYNPVAVPPSPQGGRVAVFGDDVQPGNANALTASVTPGQVFEAWVWFDASPAAPGAPRSWSLGFGSTDGIYETPDPSGTLGLHGNGNTGVSWTYQVNGSTATLYLINHNDGGWGATAATPSTVAAQIAVVSGVNDGWQRLRLERVGATAWGSFGNATAIASDPCCEGGFVCCQHWRLDWGQFDFLYAAAQASQVFVDDILVEGSTSGRSYSGVGTPTSVGIPGIAMGSPPTIGNAAFSVLASNLMPSSFSFFDISLSPATITVPGAQAGFSALSPDALVLMANSGSGTAAYTFSLPNNPAFVGVPICWQIIDVDTALPYPLPIANSKVLTTTLGAF